MDGKERGGPGAFTFQLILDNGAEAYVIRATPEDADVLMQLLSQSKGATFDRSRKILLFNNRR